MPHPRWTLGATVVAVGAALLAATGGAAASAAPRPAPSAPSAAITAASPCGASVGTTPVVRHVVWVVFENKSLSMLEASPAANAPYLSGTGRRLRVGDAVHRDALLRCQAGHDQRHRLGQHR